MPSNVLSNEWKRLKSGTDIRGVALPEGGRTVDLTDETVERIAAAFARWLSDKAGKPAAELTVSVGRDSRLSGPRIREAVIRALTARGVRAMDCGLASTPAMFMTTVDGGCDGAIQITASHHPFDRNGLKFFTPAGGLDGGDIEALLLFAQDGDGLPAAEGRAEAFPYMDRYAARLRDMIARGLGEREEDRPLSGFRIVVDAGNGAGGFYASGVLEPLGADVSGAGSPVIRITGFSPRSHAGLRIPPDRIAAATYLCCTACAGGKIELTAAAPGQIVPVLDALRAMGCAVSTHGDRIHMTAHGRPASPGAIVTRPYPGFPTDAAPLLMAASLRCTRPAMFIENIFSGRYRHAEEMRALGAQIVLRGPMALVTGVETLHGASMKSPDLRGGAALVAAALGAEGESTVTDAGHILRGYESLDETLRSLGASVWREKA
mgnify:CR=1 FL=1